MMDAGTVTLVLYLAGLGRPRWELDLLGRYFEAYPKMTLVHTRVPVHHPLVVPMRDKEACLQVAERERARGRNVQNLPYGGDPTQAPDYVEPRDEGR
jgi:hypothetical protein